MGVIDVVFTKEGFKDKILQHLAKKNQTFLYTLYLHSFMLKDNKNLLY